MRVFLALLAAGIAVAPPALALLAPVDPLGLAVTPVPLDHADRAHVRVGALTYVGGWQLRGADRRFGGISSLTVQDDRLVGLSDSGVAFWIEPHPGGVALRRIHALPKGPPGDVPKVALDSESSTYDPASGRIWAGFETSNQIWRYAPGLTRAEAHVAPPAMADWPGNRGPEAMVRLRDGRFLVFEETGAVRRDGANEALLFPGDPTSGVSPIRFAYRPPQDFAITDATELPDGRVLLLHRDFSLTQGARAALTVFDPREIAPGKLIEGREIARLAPPLTVDNMEGVAVTREQGRTIVWIVSDDNFNPLQRTLLLKFALDPAH